MKQILLLLLILLVFNGRSQVSAGPVTVQPQPVTAGGSVMIICTATTNTYGNKVSLWQVVDHTQKKIRLYGCYSQSMLTATRAYKDTFYVSALQTGTYAITFSAIESSTTQACLQIDKDSVFAALTVTATTVGVKKYSQNDPNLFPNPSKGNFNLNGIENGNIKVYDLIGNEILNSGFKQGDAFYINEKGIFTAVISSGDRIWYRKLLVE